MKTSIKPEQWVRIKETFGEVVDLPIEKQGSVLRQKFAENSIEYEETRSLLEAHQRAQAFLETPPKLLEQLVDDPLDFVSPFKTGDRIDDYQIEALLGQGSFGHVYLATQISLGRKVALKVTPDLGEEAQTLARLEHEHIVPVYAVQRLPEMRIKLTNMQWIQGPDLQSILDELPHSWDGNDFLFALDGQCHPQSEWQPQSLLGRERIRQMDQIEVALWMGVCIGKALRHAHQKEILHLDIKPGNVLLTPFAHPQLTDFNVAIQQDSIDKPQLFGGTQEYMAPEQAALFTDRERDLRSISPAADVFALGKLVQKLMGNPQLAPFSLERLVTPSPEKRVQTADEAIRFLQFAWQRYRIEKALPRLGPLLTKIGRFPVWALALVSIAPQLFGSVINITYNATRVAAALSSEQQAVFQSLIPLYNALAYPLVTAFLFITLFPLVRFLRHPDTLLQLSTLQTRQLRHRFLRFPNRIALMITLGWLPGAVFFPVGIDVLAGPIPLSVYGHFACSFVLSWLVALSYSYLGTQFVIFRLIYPYLCNAQSLLSETKPEDIPLSPRFFHYAAGTIPLVAVVLLLGFTQPNEIAGHLSEFRVLLIFLTILGGLGLLFSFHNQNQMQKIVSAFLATTERAT